MPCADSFRAKPRGTSGASRSTRPLGEVLQLLATIVRAISTLNRAIGLVFSWLSLAVVLVCFVVVVERYFLHTTHLWAQDLYVWLSGAMFTAVAGFAMLRDDHVRVDILYRQWSIRGRAIADLIGCVIFLFPFIIMVLLYAWPYVMRSWRLFEGSANIGGMPGLFILKSFVIVFCVVVGLQGIAWALRAILVIANKEDLLPESLRYRRDDPMETPL
jgi:TRAP-type mannitol/chloroaromatic compound transport system permease small subunit